MAAIAAPRPPPYYQDMKKVLCTILSNPVYVCGGIFLASGGALVFALTMQHVFGLQPCELCIWQRWPFAITGLLGLAGLVAAINPDWLKLSALTSFLAGLGFLTGGAFAFYHTGVELHWWKSFLEGCKVILPSDPHDLMSFIESAKAVPCDQVPWSFMGLSMAAWNAVISPALGILAITAGILLARRANNFL